MLTFGANAWPAPAKRPIVHSQGEMCSTLEHSTSVCRLLLSRTACGQLAYGVDTSSATLCAPQKKTKTYDEILMS